MEQELQTMDMVLDAIEKVTVLLFENKKEAAFSVIERCFGVVNQFMMQFIQNVPEYNAQFGMNLNVETLIGQERNFLEAFEEKDTAMMMDAMVFEVGKSLSLYRQLYVL